MKLTLQGKSLLELREEYGLGESGFYGNDWWLNEDFAKEKPEGGEYEITLHHESMNLTFNEQKKKLKKGFEVIHPALLAEAILSHYKNTKERLAENYYYRTNTLVSDGGRVFVGSFGSDGLSVGGGWDGDRHSDVGLASARKFRGDLSVEPSNLFDSLEISFKGKKYKVVEI